MTHALIHEFNGNAEPQFDEEGELMEGFFYQFANDDGEPITNLIGPFRDSVAVERAAKRAFARRDY